MKRLKRIIYQEIVPPALIALLVLSFVVFSREFGRLAELLIRKNAEFTTVLEVVFYLLPSILIFTVPFGFLIGTLVGFSRLSTDSEIVALRSGGVSIYQMLWPVLKLACVAGLVTLFLTLFLLPHGNWSLRQLRQEIQLWPSFSHIKPRVFNEDLPGTVLYVEDVDLRNSAWKGVFLADSPEADSQRIILAKRGYLLFSSLDRRFQLHFDEGTIYNLKAGMPEKDDISIFETLDVPVDLPETEPPNQKVKRPEDKNLKDLLSDLRLGPPDVRDDSLVEMNRRIALPLSPFLFAILAVTLGINTHRGGRGYGFVASMVIAFTYYVLFATGSELAMNGVLSPVTGVWGANIILGVLALVSLRFATVDSPLWHRITNNGFLVRLLQSFRLASLSVTRLGHRLIARVRRRFWAVPNLRLRMARVIDLYLMRTFLLYLLLSVGVCVALFYLFTLFELLDDFYAHDVSYSLLLNYFIFLLPHVLMLLIPISVLIATLVTFGLMEKSQQMTAFKACGISVYRVAMPVIVLGLLISGAAFILQEYILPYANQQQDNLRSIIKGRPPQTSQPGSHWIFGEGDHLYSYSYFNSERLVFAELSVYELDVSESRLIRHTYAQRAEWDRNRQSWVLHNGWTRSFAPDGYRPFAQLDYRLAESPYYFDEEVNQSSKMTYFQLRRYIQNLQQGGFEVDHLQTELFKKVSFPLVNLIMSILGIPFAFTMGRKGALYGVAVGVGIGIFYWGAFGVFELLGSSGMLAPSLAAWGPNLVFATGGLLLLSWVRT